MQFDVEACVADRKFDPKRLDREGLRKALGAVGKQVAKAKADTEKKQQEAEAQRQREAALAAARAKVEAEKKQQETAALAKQKAQEQHDAAEQARRADRTLCKPFQPLVGGDRSRPRSRFTDELLPVGRSRRCL